MDNHRAEFEALLYGLRHLKAHNKQDQLVFCYTDSKLVADSIRKKYTKKAEHKLYLEEALQDLAVFTNFYLEWIPEKENKGPIISQKKHSISLPKRKNESGRAVFRNPKKQFSSLNKGSLRSYLKRGWLFC